VFGSTEGGETCGGFGGDTMTRGHTTVVLADAVGDCGVFAAVRVAVLSYAAQLAVVVGAVT
jgi:hypothetical protein